MLNRSPRPSKNLKPGLPPFIGVVIAVSSGGPQTLKTFFDNLVYPFHSSIFLVQHGPVWALKSVALNLNRDYDFNIQLAEDRMKPEINHIYLAPGGTHLSINPMDYHLELTNDPPEHHLRPAADVLFRSASKAFGKYCVGIVLSGLGCDGSAGAKVISESGGTVLVQDPRHAVAKFMPQAAIDSGINHEVVLMKKMPKTLVKKTLSLSQQLSREKNEVDFK